MTSKNFKICSLAIASILILNGIIPVSAAVVSEVTETTSPTSKRADKEVSAEERISKLKEKAKQEIDRRITSLENLKNRINSMTKLSESNRTSLTSTIDTQISELNSLESKIEAETELDTLKEYVKSITQSYRIYALVIPKGAVMAAGDRVIAIAEALTQLGTKMQTAIDEAKATEADVSKAETAMKDFSSKLIDAKSKAQAAIDAVSTLSPDGGDKDKMQSNLDALKSAKEKIKDAHEDIVAARKDATEIVKILKALNGSETQTQTQTETQTSSGTSAE